MHKLKIVIMTLICALLVTLAAGAIFISSGLLNVSARWEDPAWLKWIIVTTRERSLDVRKVKVEVPTNLDDHQVALRGFKYYREMCVGCHRSPGLDDSEIARGLNPQPPNFAHLKEEDVDPPEYFLIIRNGIRMTAMSAWGVTHADDKIWAMVAFLKKLPGMTPEQYQALDQEAGHELDEH
jgi:mono/diheme cytochrome c family protein